jgi:HEAT repeat protein
LSRFKVRLFYSESKPENLNKKFQIDYEIEEDNFRAAIKSAIRRFMSYQNFNFASWIRTVIEEDTIVVIDVDGRYLDEYSPVEVLALLDRDDANLRIRVVEGIRWIKALRENEAIIARLHEFLKGEDLTLRFSSVETLRKSGAREILDQFKQMLEKEDSDLIRASMLAMIGEQGVKDMIGLVYPHLKHSGDRVRANAVEAIERLGSAEDIVHIQPLLDDPNNRVRANVIKAIWKLGGFHRTENIEEMLASSNELMRASAAYALGEIHSAKSARMLEKFVSDPAAIVRRNVVRGLKKLGDQDSVPMLVSMLAEKDSSVLDIVKDTILSLGDDATNELLKALENDELKSAATEMIDILRKVKLRKGRLWEWLSLTWKRGLR